MLRAAILGTLIVSASCSRSEGEIIGSSSPPAGAANGSAGSAGGFSADLAKELGSGGKTAGGSAAGGEGREPGKPDAAAGGEVAPAVGSDAAKAGSAQPEIEMEDPAAEPTKPGKKPRGPVRVPEELSAIKLSLLPNWDRDIDEPGTFQYVVRIKGTQSTKTFRFHYGYDDPRAPADRDQYKKFLQDQKLLTGDIKDRQRGAAWFLEGQDARGLPAFRFVVLYGGKRLVCYGSLYKDADSNRLGDDRDQTLIQAKQICETLAL